MDNTMAGCTAHPAIVLSIHSILLCRYANYSHATPVFQEDRAGHNLHIQTRRVGQIDALTCATAHNEYMTTGPARRREVNNHRPPLISYLNNLIQGLAVLMNCF